MCFLGWPAATVLSAEQSISTSRQFIVYGTDLAVRGAICEFAERTKRDLLALLGQGDNWTTAIVVNARYPQANVPELPHLNVELGQTGFGLRLQLDLVVDPTLSRPEIRRELLRALLLEMMYRHEPQLPAGTVYSSPPDWLLEGVPSEQAELSRDSLRKLLAFSTAAGHAWPLEKFLRQRADLLDAATRNLYRAYSFALVDLLNHSPDGQQRLAQLIVNWPRASNDPMAELRGHFPELLGSDAAEPTWQKQIARLAGDQPYQLLSGAETERRLSEILRVNIPGRDQQRRYDLTQFPAFLKHKSARAALAVLSADLRALATRAHPVYAPLVADYAEIAALIQRGKTLDVPKRLKELANFRRTITAQMREIDDYLDWFEATSVPGLSGRFADYMKAAERAAQPDRHRRDAISVYLDALETQFDERSARR